jgi:ATP-dependent DNA ligase
MRNEHSYKSKSSDAVYTTVEEDGFVSCNCPGFIHNRKCWHSTEIMAKYGAALKEREQQSLFGEEKSIEGFVEPMLARANVEGISIDSFNDGNHVMEWKYDGHRLIVKVDSTGVTAWSRAGNIRPLHKDLVEELRMFSTGIYDGELHHPDGTSTDVTALDKLHLLNLTLFDILETGGDGFNVKGFEWHVRRQILEQVYERAGQPFNFVNLSMPCHPSEETLRWIMEEGGEGAIVKHKNSVYEVGKRSRSWIKFKKEVPVECTLIGFEQGLLGPCSRLVVRDDTGTVFSSKAKNDAWRAQFERDGEKLFGSRVVISTFGRSKNGKYVSPMADHFPNGEVK